MTRFNIISEIKAKNSLLCVGLDTDIQKIPDFLLKERDPILKFNQLVIEATQDLCIAYKPNLAFYESQGPKGLVSLEKTVALIPDNIFTIADAKRGDIGNTSKMYAKAFFDYYNFDAVTVAPYMGIDSVSPFLEFDNKWVILLGLTSNKGSEDFQLEKSDDKVLYEQVIRKAQSWGSPENLMFVIGATHSEKIANCRRLAKDHFFLVPGVGAQGGDLQSVIQFGSNDNYGLMINSSRGIIYAGKGKDFQKGVRNAAMKLQQQMANQLVKNENNL